MKSVPMALDQDKGDCSSCPGGGLIGRHTGEPDVDLDKHKSFLPGDAVCPQ